MLFPMETSVYQLMWWFQLKRRWEIKNQEKKKNKRQKIRNKRVKEKRKRKRKKYRKIKAKIFVINVYFFFKCIMAAKCMAKMSNTSWKYLYCSFGWELSKWPQNILVN